MKFAPLVAFLIFAFEQLAAADRLAPLLRPPHRAVRGEDDKATKVSKSYIQKPVID